MSTPEQVVKDGLPADRAVSNELRKMEELQAEAERKGSWLPQSFSEYLNLCLMHRGFDDAKRLAEQQYQDNPSNVHFAYEFARFLCHEDHNAGIAWYSGFLRKVRTPLAHYWFSQLYAGLGEHAQVMSVIEDISRYASRLPDLLNSFIFSSMYSEDLDGAEHLARLRGMVRRQFGVPIPPSGTVSRRPRYIVGFVCSSLNGHAISCFAEPLIRGLDRKTFMVIVFSSAKKKDDITAALRALPDLWYDVENLTDPQLLELIRSERPDVLIDLDNHTLNNRLWVFAQRAAPIQISCYGFNTSTGLEAMDYRLTDPVVDPPGADAAYTEKLLRTRYCHYSYWSFTDVPPPEIASFQQNGYFTFGSFNTWPKINRRQVTRWVEILNAFPDSRLKVVGYDDGFARLRLQGWLQECGLDRSRVSIEGRMPLLDLHRRVQAVDLALDSWPFGGGVTTTMTLRLGVPVLTALGPRAASRAGASALKDMGAERYVAEHPDVLLARARELVADPAQLAVDRSVTAERFQATVGSGARMASEVGELIIRAIERFRKGKPAEQDQLP
jgi:predicted O-linked N-acetylglucosamine transferase (SPINDLY family)